MCTEYVTDEEVSGNSSPLCGGSSCRNQMNETDINESRDAFSEEYAASSLQAYLEEYFKNRIPEDAGRFGSRLVEDFKEQNVEHRRTRGVEAGEAKANVRILKNLMANTGMTMEDAMEAIGLEDEERARCEKELHK